jgi:hypothetical protein
MKQLIEQRKREKIHAQSDQPAWKIGGASSKP